MKRKFQRFIRVTGAGIVGGSVLMLLNLRIVGDIWGMHYAGLTGSIVLVAWIMVLAMTLARLDARDAARAART